MYKLSSTMYRPPVVYQILGPVGPTKEKKRYSRYLVHAPTVKVHIRPTQFFKLLEGLRYHMHL